MTIHSVINFLEVKKVERLDAEYFRSDFVTLEKKVTSLKFKLLDQIAGYINRGVQPEYDEEGTIPVLRTVNVRGDGFANTRQEFVNNDFYQQNTRGQVKVGDILITSTGVGTLGRITYNFETSPFFADGHITLIRDISEVNPLFVAVFLQSEVGQALIQKRQRGSSGQIEIYSSDIGSIPIPEPPTSFQVDIEARCKQAQSLREQSKQLYLEAENLLLDTLDIDDKKQSPQIAYTATFKEAKNFNRLDAEYFHPEKMFTLGQLEELQGKQIQDYFYPVNEILNPSGYRTDETVYNYDLTNALKYYLSDDVPIVPAYELGSNKKRFKRGDVVVSRLRSYLQEIAVVATPSNTNCVGSTEFFVFRAKNDIVSPELLMVYLRCSHVQKILKWCQNGSNHPRFDDKEVLMLKLPDKIINIQRDIQHLIQRSIDYQKSSRKTLEEAKKQIEHFIMNGE